jgi:hypothetical protein
MMHVGYVGWDQHDGGSVYAIPLGGTLLKVPYTIGGSGSAYITGAQAVGWCLSEVCIVLKKAGCGRRRASPPEEGGRTEEAGPSGCLL